MRLIMLFWKRFTIEIEDSNKQFFNATSSQCETLRIWWYSESLPRSLWRAINTQQTNFRIVIVAVLIDRGNSDKISWPFESRNSHIAEKCSVSKTATVYKNVYVKNLKALTYNVYPAHMHFYPNKEKDFNLVWLQIRFTCEWFIFPIKLNHYTASDQEWIYNPKA